jgi:hypothetical protein
MTEDLMTAKEDIEALKDLGMIVIEDLVIVTEDLEMTTTEDLMTAKEDIEALKDLGMIVIEDLEKIATEDIAALKDLEKIATDDLTIAQELLMFLLHGTITKRTRHPKCKWMMMMLNCLVMRKFLDRMQPS